MRKMRLLLLALCLLACLTLVLALRAALPAPPTVIVSVEATDSSGGVLHYRWIATDGTIKNVNAPSTTWVLPNGPGLHFAYVLVSNGLGGYTERRVAVNTDTIGTAPKTPPPVTLAAPPAEAQQGDYYRTFLSWGAHNVGSIARSVYMPNLPVYLEDGSSGTRYPANTNAVTNGRGEAIISGVPPGNNYSVNCSADGGVTFSDCAGDTIASTMLLAATSDYILNGPTISTPFSGSFTLQDGSPCGTVNEFFGVHVTATAALRDTKQHILAGPVPIDEYGDYSLPPNPNASSVLLRCEGAQPVVVKVRSSTNDLGPAVLSGVSTPTVTAMSAKLNGQEVGIFPPEFPLPSDILTRADGFLAEKGLDSRLGACQYYKAVGAVKGCGRTGGLQGAISFEDWKRTVKIDKYAANGVAEYSATYINKMDLNLTRVHHSVSYSADNTAAYVCNHLGPPFSLTTAQQDIDTAIDNAVNGLNLVACVAMDYTVTPGVNSGQPFIRFLIFGPSGQLLPSINLDGRREKFVPGTCVVCHGGDHYAGKFAEDGSGFANVGGHFLPYDTGNFEFSSKAGLTEGDQENQIYLLNQNVLNADPTLAEQDLIAGWYAKGNVLDKLYVPQSYKDAQAPFSISSISRLGGLVTVNTVNSNPFTSRQSVTIAGVADASFDGKYQIFVNSPTQFTYGQSSNVSSTSAGGTATLITNAVTFYRNVIARSCRSCHVAMVEGYNFDHYQNIAPFTYGQGRFADTGFDMETNVCGGSQQVARDHTMPNSLVTFNRLWLTYKNGAGLPDQVSTINRFYGSDNTNNKPCAPGTSP